MRSSFEYYRPANASEAQLLKAKLGKTAAYWAGGTDIILQWQRAKRHIEHCIDITHAGMNTIKVENDQIRIGATVTISDLEDAASIHPYLAVIAKTAKKMATPQVRTVATIGGNLCNAVPSAELAPPLMVLDAKLVTTSNTYAIGEFFTGVRQTVLAEDELLTEIVIPLKAGTAADYERISRSSVDISLAGAAAAVTADVSGVVTDCRIALNAVAPTPVRGEQAEKFLIGKKLSDLSAAVLLEAGRLAVESTKPISDIRGSAEFRQYSSKVTVKRALENAISVLKGAK